MYTIFISLFFIFTIKCEAWWPEVKGHSIGDYDNGFAGSYPKNSTDFYLCSERYYRVHYLGEDNNTWSENFTACQPAGKCTYIDGLAITGGKPYSVRFEESWPENFTWGFDINNSSGGYAGRLGIGFCSILIYGNEYYRNSDTHRNYLCSQEEDVAKRIVYYLFGNSSTYNIIYNSTYNYSNETPIEMIKNKKIKASVILLKPQNISIKGKLTIKIESSSIEKKNYKGLITDKYTNVINEIIGFNFNDVKNFFEGQIKNGMYNGDIGINFDWKEKKIIIEFGSKIDRWYYAHRGGFRININLYEEDFELLEKIRNICKFFLRYFGKRITPDIRDLLSNFNSFESVIRLLKYLDNHPNIVEEVILFTILEKILVFEK